MIATTRPLALPFGINTTIWAYEVCPRPAGDAPNECAPKTAVQPWGGVRFALQKGDTLRIRLVNKLPVITDSKHCPEPGMADLVNNPTNLHTHGLIVEPHRAEGPSDTYGDYVFLEIKNPANHGVCKTPSAPPYNASGKPNLPFKICSASNAAGLGVPGALHPDTDVLEGAAEYSIQIPATHPSGLYWFHPHLHGIAMNQITSGMSGVITIGNLADICADPACVKEVNAGHEQFLTFKDAQLEANGTLDNQQDPVFCGGSGDGGHGGIIYNGSCLGGTNHPGGHWFHTVNGLVYPTAYVGPNGAIWRMLNSSPSRSYNMQLLSGNGALIPMQILAVDGVTIESSASSRVLQQALGGKATTVPCPSDSTAVCVTNFEMMPSSRVELRVINTSTQAQQANLQTAEYLTGPGGDDWPKINLASVMLAPASSTSLRHLNVGGARALLSDRGPLGQAATIQIPGTNEMVPPAVKRAAMNESTRGPILQESLRQTQVFAIDPALQSGLRRDPACAPLAAGHRRRIYFGYPTPSNFGLGYVEVDNNDNEVPGTLKPLTPFDPSVATVCLPLAAGNKPAQEVWELVNLTSEDHNFHIHQTKFTLLSNDQVTGQNAYTFREIYVLHDNVPLPHANAACDGTLATAEAPGSKCHPTKVYVRIPFSEIGDFVYHCHIMEHEDGGMMARIRVVPSP